MAITGEVVFQRIADMGGTLDLNKVRRALGPVALEAKLQPSRSAPDYVKFAAPIPLNLSAFGVGDCVAEDGTPITVSARLYEVGALAIMIRYPASCEKVEELARFNNLKIRTQNVTLSRAQLFDMIGSAVRPRIKPALDEIFDTPVEPERYTAFCLKEVPNGAAQFLNHCRNHIAGLLVAEPTPERLSRQEVDEILRQQFSYYDDDSAIVDWDAACIIEPSGQYEDFLYLSEVANLQLMVLRKYDHYLDTVLEKSYEDYKRMTKGPPIFAGPATSMIQELSEVRMDLAKVTDELDNMAKFFGDWYLARVYLGLESKLHIGNYHKMLENKVTTLNELYQTVLAEIDRRQNVILEVMIVLLIVVELILGFVRH